MFPTYIDLLKNAISAHSLALMNVFVYCRRHLKVVAPEGMHGITTNFTIRNHLHLKVADEKMKCSSVFDSLFVCGCLCDYVCPGAGAVTMAPRTLKLGIGTLLNIL